MTMGIHNRQPAAAVPDSIESQLLLANRLADADDFDSAIAHYRAILERQPACTAAWFNLGRTLQDVERYVDSAESYLRAIELEPGFRDAGLNLGIVLRILGRIADAASLFDELIAADAHDAQAHLQRSLTRLAVGDFGRGWDEYVWRWRAEALPQRVFDNPQWDGQPMSGTVLISAEQGIGDEIQFASCLPEVLQRADRVVLECEPRLVPLFSRSFPECGVIPAPVSGRRFDAQVSIGDLPRFFRRSFGDFPQRTSWLVADGEAVARWKARFAELGNARVIGIAWRGGRKPADRRSRSVPLEALLPILRTPETCFVSVQHGDVGDEIRTMREHSRVTLHDWPDADPLKDLDGFAAMLTALDLVVSVDNSTVHLAGALGVPAWTLLPFAADFRWLRDTDRSPWYPTLRLLRQPQPGEWQPVVTAAVDALNVPESRSDVPPATPWRPDATL